MPASPISISTNEEGAGVADTPPTVKLADAVLPVPPSFELTLPVVLFLVPSLAPVTFTEKVHDALAASVAPDKLILPEPAVAVIVPPPHEPFSPFGVATTSPDGSVSVTVTPLTEEPLLGLLIVKLKLVVPFTAIVDAPNVFVIVGEEIEFTVKLAEAVRPVPPSFELTVPVVLFLLPAVVPFTSTEKVHDEPAPGDAVNVPPDRLMVLLPAVAVIVPLPQEPVTLYVGSRRRCHASGQVVGEGHTALRTGVWVGDGEAQRTAGVQRNRGWIEGLGDRWRRSHRQCRGVAR